MRKQTFLLKPIKLWQVISAGAFVLVAIHALGSTSDDLENLGSNQQVNERAAHLENRTRLGVVQGRAVDRNWRVELGTSYGPVAYGNSYLYTQNAGINADLHVNPRFSLGFRYAKSFNQLTNEGKAQFDQARISNSTVGSFQKPQISYPEDQMMGVINWYMTYGKINFFDMKTVQFDIYSVAGYGQVKISTEIDNLIKSDWTNTWTAGMGVGFWLSQHFTSRVEVRYQTYADQAYTGSQNLNVIVGTLGLGVLL